MITFDVQCPLYDKWYISNNDHYQLKIVVDLEWIANNPNLFDENTSLESVLTR